MANPFPSKFDGKCPSCGSQVLKGDDMYACGDKYFLCSSCASEAGFVCACGLFKKEEYPLCFACTREQPQKDEWDPWASATAHLSKKGEAIKMQPQVTVLPKKLYDAEVQENRKNSLGDEIPF